MTYTYDIEFFKCGTCTSKIHCEKCGAEIADTLQKMDGVVDAGLNIPENTAFVEMKDGYDDEDVVDALDNMGVFV